MQSLWPVKLQVRPVVSYQESSSSPQPRIYYADVQQCVRIIKTHYLAETLSVSVESDYVVDL
jgi:hypothetical protein